VEADLLGGGAVGASVVTVAPAMQAIPAAFSASAKRLVRARSGTADTPTRR
jgi:hypothetical protein